MKDTQELRKELQNVKKLARERAKAITLRIPQLKDCKNHFDKKKEIPDFLPVKLVVPVEE